MGMKRSTPFRLAVVAAALGTLIAPAAARAQGGPPPPMPAREVSFPKYHEARLSSGAVVIVVENHEQPVVTIDLRIESGTAFDPPDEAGLAGMTAALLDKGTTNRSAEKIAETIDFVGGSLGAAAGPDWTSVGSTVLTQFVDTALALMSDVVLNPTFPVDELATQRTRTLSSLQVALSQPGAVAARHFTELLYGGYPYGGVPTPESVKAISRDDIVAFHRRYYRPGNALFVVAGDVDPKAIVRRLDRYFGHWSSGEVLKLTEEAPPSRTERQIYLYHKPGSVQAAIRVGELMPPATNADWPALDVALRILGGGSTGWLYRTLREEKGYTYGAYAGAAERTLQGYFQASVDVRNGVADSAMSVLFDQLRRLREDSIPAADLRLAKNYLTGSFPRSIETPQQVADQVADARLHGLPDDYVKTYRDRIAEVTAEDVRRVARAHLHPDRMVVVVVGDATKILGALKPFGSVQLFDVEGKSLPPEDLEVRAAAVSFDPSGIEPVTLVRSLRVQGNPVADFTKQVTRTTEDGRGVIESVNRGSAGPSSTEQRVRFDARDFTPIDSHLSQQAPGGRISLDLSYVDGRVTGRIVGPGGDTTRVDTTVVKGTILPGMDAFVVWLANLDGSREITVPAFDPQSGGAYNLQLEVLGDTTLTVPAGTFEAYRLRMTTPQATTIVYARKQAPHIVLRQEFQGRPIVLELKEMKKPLAGGR